MTLGAQEDGPLQSQGLGESFVHRDGLWQPCAHDGCAKIWKGGLAQSPQWGMVNNCLPQMAVFKLRCGDGDGDGDEELIKAWDEERASFQTNPPEVNIEQREGRRGSSTSKRNRSEGTLMPTHEPGTNPRGLPNNID